LTLLKPPSPRLLLGILGTLLFGAAGGWLFLQLTMPLPWLIGALVLSTVAALMGAPLKGPGTLRNVMIGVLGIMLGSSFTPDALANAGDWVLSISILVLFVVTVVGMVSLYLTKVGGYDPVSAYFSASPGGLATMVSMGMSMGGDERLIGLTHSVRIMLTVLIIPFWFRFFAGYVPGDVPDIGSIGNVSGMDLLILGSCALGYPLAKALRFPAASMMGPLLLSAAVHMAGFTAAKPPSEIVNLAQVVIGTGIGCRFVGIPVRHVINTLVTSAGATLFMLGLAAVAALGLEQATGLPFQALWLSFSPGGLAEMTLISLSMGIDTAFVSTHHLLRVLFMVLAAPLVFSILRKRFSI